MQELLTNLGPLISTYGYIVLFLLAMVEGPIVGLVAGALAATGQLDLIVVFLVLYVADLVGDVLYYLLGRWGDIAFLKRISNRLGLNSKKVEPIEKRFRENDWKILLFGKTQAWGSLILYFAGTVNMSFWRFLWWNAVGTLPKVLLFEAAGYFFAQSVAQSQHYLNYVGIGAFILAALLVAGYFVFKRYLGKQVS